MAKQNKDKTENDFVDISNIEQIQKEFMSTQDVKPKQKRVKKTQPKEEESKKEEKNKGGRPKNISTPELMMEHFSDYVKETKANPFKVKDWVGKDAYEVKREKERPLTMEGFENYCFLNGIITDLSHYFCNLDNRYSEFVGVCSRIRLIIRQDQIEGGMANIYNPSITQRLNGLAEKQELKQDITANVKTNIDYSNLSSETLTDLLNNSQKND